VAAVAHSEVRRAVLGYGRGAGPCSRDEVGGAAPLLELVEKPSIGGFPWNSR
jgi:hypothetical protein